MSKQYTRKDALYLKAKAEGYRSRASYKLLELNKRERLFRKGMKVVDLGCFPGGWLQVAANLVSPKGRVVGIDLKEVEPLGLENVDILLGDASNRENIEKILSLLGGRSQLLLSDMSPALTGTKFGDAAKSAETARIAFELADDLLKANGSLVAKVFPGEEANELFKEFKGCYKSLRRVKLKSTRTSSNEYYIVAKNFKA